jgi:hypothetical protein
MINYVKRNNSSADESAASRAEIIISLAPLCARW